MIRYIFNSLFFVYKFFLFNCTFDGVTRLWKKSGSTSRFRWISRGTICRILLAKELRMDQHAKYNLVIWEKTHNRLRRETSRQPLRERVALRDTSMGKCQEY